MVDTITKVLVIVFFLSLSGCSSQMEMADAQFVDLLTAFDFDNGDQGWEGGISDFPVDYQDSAEFYVSNDVMANSLSSVSRGLNISADNAHGNMFYYFMRKVSNLEPGTRYKLDFEFLVYTQLLGTPDGEIYLKIGATNFEPQLEPMFSKNATEYLMLNIDKGGLNSDSGSDLVNIGSIKEFTGDTPEVIAGNSFDFPIEVITNANGEVWLIIGVDSGITGQLTFGMTALTVYYRKQI